MIDDRLIARVAELFYVHNINQYEIAKKFNFSKAKVCRIIKDAKKKKIIQFTIKNFDARRIDLEKSLEEKFGLKEAIIYVNPEGGYYDENLISQEIGLLGSQFMQRILKDNLNIAVTWGRTLYHMFNKLEVDKKYKIKIFATLGGVTTGDAETHNNNLVQILAGKTGGTPYPIYMPLILEKADHKKMLSESYVIKEVLGDASKIDYYFAGVGAIIKNSHLYNPNGDFNQAMLNKLKDKKICGEMGLNFYDIDGNFIDSGLEERAIYLDINEIKKIKNIIVAAFGKEKITPMLGILRTGIISVLITDSITAQSLIYNS